MKIFLDTANRKSIEKWVKSGLIDGVTTNPSHLSKEGSDPKAVVKDICEMLPQGDISVEITQEEPAEVYKQAREIAALSDNIVVKIPCHPAYFTLINQLVSEGVAINITLLFSVMQGIMMAKLGVRYVSPFIGRLHDIGSDGLQLISDLRQAFDEHGFYTEILAASTRTVHNLQEVALIGADAVTVSVENFEKAMHHPLTDKGMRIFLEDWQKLGVKKFP